MTKSELIQYLKSYSEACDATYRYSCQVSELKQMIASRKKKPTRSKIEFYEYKNALFIIMIGACFVSLASLILLSLVSGHKLGNYFLFFVIGSYIFISALWFIYHKRKYAKENHYHQEKYEKELLTIPALERQLQTALSNLQAAHQREAIIRQKNILPAKYASGGIAHQLMKYLADCRADTLKEAINLYEAWSDQVDRDWAELEHRTEIERQQKLQTKYAAEARDEASRAADAAEQSARSANFWGSVNAYLLDELGRKNK